MSRFTRVPLLTVLALLSAVVGPGALSSAASAVAPATSTATPAATSATSVSAARAAAAPAVPGASRYTSRIAASTRQVLVVSASSWSSTTAVLRAYQRTAAGGWQKVLVTKARLGAGALVGGTKRVQGTSSTPAGKYAITSGFGRQADPGTRLPYTKVTSAHWWVQDRNSRYYNQMRTAAQGGFLMRTSGYNGSEHLIDFGRQYDYAAVIDFNRPDPVIGRGSGIFLHVSNGKSTAGCVSVSRAAMVKIMKWLDPAKSPQIIIGPNAWLSR